MNLPDFLTPTEAASLLRVSVKTLMRWCSSQKPTVPFINIGNGERRTIRFHRDTIIAKATKTT